MKYSIRIVRLCAILMFSCGSDVFAGTDPRQALSLSAQPTTEEIRGCRVLEEPLVPIGAKPTPMENAPLAEALRGYSKRSVADDFSLLTGFLEKHPRSPWRAALLTGLGLEYYNRAYYSRALDAWKEAWELGQNATDAAGKFLADRAVCELAGLYSRLGRMSELEALLKSFERRTFLGGAAERINLAREALWMMQNQPGVSFRCGPLALKSIRHSLNPEEPLDMAIFNSASTQQGFSLPQVDELARKTGLNYRMAYRQKNGDFLVPSVVHWRVGHYAALVRQVGDLYLLEDPTFGNRTWATKRALETETSGYFLIPPGALPQGWRSVEAKEGGAVWGKGVTSENDPDAYTEDDLQTGECSLDEMGMAVSSVHLMLANLQIRDTPVGYVPPVGPPVRFTVRYNHRDYLQPVNQTSSGVLGPNWAQDWSGFIRDDLFNPLADVKYFVGGGGARRFIDFNPITQTFAPQQYDQTLLKRTGPNSYDLIFPNGSKRVFGQRVGNTVHLTQVVDPAGNAVTLTYGENGLVALTDAIGQVTTISYNHPSNSFLITKVTDPFGRFATFDYGEYKLNLNYNNPTNETKMYMLTNITDVLGLSSGFLYSYLLHTNVTPMATNIMRTNLYFLSMTTPYGNTFFNHGQAGTTRWVETIYPDASRDRVEFNQNTNGIAFSDPPAIVPLGMSVLNQWLHGRNTFYWSRTACATAYGDYSKAKIYHWLHTENLTTAAGILESTKEPLERRVWYDYPGQSSAIFVGSSSKPRHVGRVLDDTTTQLYTYGYNGFGNLINSIDPLGRRLSFVYAANDIDLQEVRMTRAGKNELLFRATYNSQHRPLTMVDASGQTNTFTYNARGQPLTRTNPQNETTTYVYDANGYLLSVNGPLPGASDVVAMTHDTFGRVRTLTSGSGDTLTFDYDAMGRVTKITYPDSTDEQFTYSRLDRASRRDRAGRVTLFEHDNVRQVKQQTDPLGRVTRFEWCRCGAIKSLVDPMGRVTEWHTDVQGRLIDKQYNDGSKISYLYENATSRLREVIDEKGQRTQHNYNRDNTLKSVAYANTTIPTSGASYIYDPDYERVVSITDAAGTRLYSYVPIHASPVLGAGNLASVDGPLPNDTITYSYDELGRNIAVAINGVASRITFDSAGRIVGETNALGSFTYGYEGSSGRLVSELFPNGQTTESGYGNNLQDHTLQRITHTVGATTISEFLYGHDVSAGRITTWSQKAGALAPSLYTFGYDAVNQLLSTAVTNSGSLIETFAYDYDAAGNRLTEQIGVSNVIATYNALNQIGATTASGALRTNEWDAEDRLVAVNTGNQRTELTYDSQSRLVSIRLLTNNSEVSFRRFLWCGGRICEERDVAGVVTKRFFDQGMKVETGPAAGSYYYTRDHLGSIREVADAAGSVRARYAYDPYGRRTRLAGDLEADFGFAGMFWSSEAGLSLTHYRAYDPELGRWLSRDPLDDAEVKQGPNLYAYVANNPVNYIDPEGLCLTTVECTCLRLPMTCAAAGIIAAKTSEIAQRFGNAACDIGGRVRAIAERAPEALRLFQSYLTEPSLDSMMKLGIDHVRNGQNYWAWVYNLPPQLWIDITMSFDEVALLLSQRLGLSLPAARTFLSQLTGFYP